MESKMTDFEININIYAQSEIVNHGSRLDDLED